MIADGVPAHVLTPTHLRQAYGIEAQVRAHPLVQGRVWVLMA
jgi:iron complex transport system ATP-binding protein